MRKIQICQSSTQMSIIFVLTLAWTAFFLIYFKRYTSDIDQDGQLINITVDRVKIDLIKDVEAKIPNLPVRFWIENYDTKLAFNDTCAPFPDLLSLDYNNIYWQKLTATIGTEFHLFGAYFDDRVRDTIRILAMIDRVQPITETFCQIWFEDKIRPVIVPVASYHLIWYPEWGMQRDGILQPYLLTCNISDGRNSSAKSVSLVENPCDVASNSLKVIDNRSKKKDFAVCVKGLDFLREDLSVQLVQWIELLGLLGVDKIFFYNLYSHPNIMKVLNYYQELGKVHVADINLPGTQPNAPDIQHWFLKSRVGIKRLDEIVHYNDCFYKHVHEYRYISLLDIDEIIVPKKVSTWKTLMEKLPKDHAAYCTRNVYFLDVIQANDTFEDIPPYMRLLRNVYRTQNYTKPGYFVKCFHDTEEVVTLHNHYPISCFENFCRNYDMDIEDVHLQHYRKDCNDIIDDCQEYKEDIVLDTTLWKYKDSLIGNVTSTLRTLGFFS